MAHYRWARISTSWLPDEIARRRGDRTLRRTSVDGSKPAWLAFRGSAFQGRKSGLYPALPEGSPDPTSSLVFELQPGRMFTASLNP